LNKVFAVMHRRDTPQVSNSEAARAISETGVAITAAEVEQLRTAQIVHPPVEHVSAIAAYFGVPARFLLNGDPEVDAQLDLLRQLRDNQIRDIHLCRRNSNGSTNWDAPGS